MSAADQPSEAEKTLRYLLSVLGGDIGLIARPRKAAIAMNALGALLAEHEREVSAARDAALEEAEAIAEASRAEAEGFLAAGSHRPYEFKAEMLCAEGIRDDIRALKSSPGKRWLDADEAAEVLKQAMGTGGAREPVLWAMGRLGLALPQGPKPCPLHPECIQSAGHEGECVPTKRCADCGVEGPELCATCEAKAKASQDAMPREPEMAPVPTQPIATAPPPPAEPPVWRECPVPSCALGKGHDGDCLPEEDSAPPPPTLTVDDLCPNPSCMKDKGHKEPCDPLDED